MYDPAAARPSNPDRVEEDLSWHDRGACRDRRYNPDDWWQELARTKAGLRAKKICLTVCPVREECLDYALRHDERKGVWGGLGATEREELMAERAEGTAA